MERADGQPLDLVDWSDRPDSPHVVANHTATDIEEQIMALRLELKTQSGLGEYGAETIRRKMMERGFADVESERTLNRILERNGAFDGRRRVRHTLPPKGWYLPEVAKGTAEIEGFDVICGLVIEGGTDVEVLTAIEPVPAIVESWLVARICYAARPSWPMCRSSAAARIQRSL